MRSRLKWMGTAALALCLAGSPEAFAAGGFHGGGGGGGFHGGGGGFHGGGGWHGGGWNGGGWHGGGWRGGVWYGGWGYGGWGYPYWGWGDYGWGSPYLYGGTPYSYGYAYEPPPQPDGNLYCVTKAHMCGLDAAQPPGSRCACSGGRGKVMVLQSQ